MPQNPYVRTIRLFHPAEDLAVDNANPRRVRKRRPPVNPAEGLLDDDEPTPTSAPSVSAAAPAPDAVGGGLSDAPERVQAPSAAPAASPPGHQSEKFESSVLGEVPEMIDLDSGEFPEPIDL